MINPRDLVHNLASILGGKVTEEGALPDGRGFACVSYPLPKDHWLYADHPNVPPMPLRCGTDNPLYRELHEALAACARYAYRAASMNGKEQDIDPDALVQNLLVAVFGYHTPDGLSEDSDQNPSPVPPELCSVHLGSRWVR